MATFLEKNKKKSALAALLLFLRTRKTVITLLILVALASFLFVSPSNFILGFPGGARVAAGVAWLAGKVGVNTSSWGLGGGKRDYDDLLAAFRAAKDGSGKAGWAAFMGGKGGSGGSGGGGMDGDSLGFVKGNAKDLDAKGGSGANLPKPGSVAGVLNPDDDKNGRKGDGDSVALSKDDLKGEGEGLVKSAFAGGFGSFGNGGFGGGNGSGATGMLSGGPFASSNLFGKGPGAVGTTTGDLVKGGVSGLGIAGQTVKGVQYAAGAKGQISGARATTISAHTAQGLVNTHTISGQRAFVQLASGRGRAAISVAPNCTAESGCPTEFAVANTGAVYDGNTLSGTHTDVITTGGAVPDIGEVSVPNVPDTGMVDGYIKEAEQMNKDAEKCKALDVQYAPQERAGEEAQKALSKAFEDRGCGEGGCSKSKAKACQAIGDQIKAQCRVNSGVLCQHYKQCPLTANNNCDTECDGPAKKMIPRSEMNNGMMITTQDQRDGCPAMKNQLPGARQAVHNAIDQYRGNDCVSLRGQQSTIAGQLKYLSKCSGREAQVVNNCKNYALVLCKSGRDCSDSECTGNAPECVITNLNGIEEFISKEPQLN